MSFPNAPVTPASAAPAGDMVSTNNLSDVQSAATSFDNIKQAATATYAGVVTLDAIDLSITTAVGAEATARDTAIATAIAAIPAGSGDVSSDVATSTVGQFAIFNDTTGKLISTITPGSGVGVAFLVDAGTTGGFLLCDGALGTPSSGTLTNCTGLPISTGVSGLGTGIATALAVNTGSAGAPVLFNGALGTPSSGTLTSCTGLPISTGVSGLGTSVATALAVNVGSAGAFVIVGGALGTPSSGTLTSCTGLPISTGVSGLGTGVATALAANTNATGGVSTVGSIPAALGITIDGGGSAITTGVKGYLYVPYACTITSATLLADQSGSAVVDIWKCTYAQFDGGSTHPVSGDKITASAPPTLTAATKSQDTTLTGWTTSVSAGDVLAFSVTSASSVTRLSLGLKITK